MGADALNGVVGAMVISPEIRNQILNGDRANGIEKAAARPGAAPLEESDRVFLMDLIARGPEDFYEQVHQKTVQLEGKGPRTEQK